MEAAGDQCLDPLLDGGSSKRSDARIPTGAHFDVRRQAGVDCDVTKKRAWEQESYIATSQAACLDRGGFRTEVEKLAAAQRKFAETMLPIECIARLDAFVR